MMKINEFSLINLIADFFTVFERLKIESKPIRAT